MLFTPFQLGSHTLKNRLEERFGLTQDFMQRLATWNRPLNAGDRARVIRDFGDAAGRACAAGFEAVELHGLGNRTLVLID